MLSEPVTMVPFGCFLEVLPGDERVSVLVCESARDVHGVQQDEDVGLQELDQQLEEADRDEEQPRQESDGLQEGGAVHKEVVPAEGEEQDQDVASAHVRE